jgi:DNA-binding CsgD family transcriptional regulator
LGRISSDLRTVLDANGIERAVLFGATFGAQIAVRFAVDYPERTQAMALVGGFAKLTRLGDFDFNEDPDQIEVWAKNVSAAWGSGAAVGAHAPGRGDDGSYAQWAARLERHTCAPSAAGALCRWVATTDVTSLLADVLAPTLVIHRNGDRSLPVESGRELAEGIPDAVYVELSGDDHTFFLGDQRETVDEMITFLDERVTGGSVRKAQRRSDRSGTAGIGWKSLTLSEQEVARLAAAGKTNAEIARRLRLSPHTVDGRLRRVFAKLAIKSRVELTAEYDRVNA